MLMRHTDNDSTLVISCQTFVKIGQANFPKVDTFFGLGCAAGVPAAL
jgi:hypothetical protein